MRQTDVIVVGAGPTGLFLAGELAMRGVRVRVLERLAEPDDTIKAGSVNVASSEILDRRGFLPATRAVQRRLLESIGSFAGGAGTKTAGGLGEAVAQSPRRFPAVGHFAGMLYRNDLVDQTDPVLRAHTAAADGVLVPQHDLELMLADRCTELGVEIHRGVEVRGARSTGADLGDDADVVVQTDAGDVTTGWVVAADGGRSVLRKQLGIEFLGTDPQLVGYQAIADFDDPSQLSRGWTWTPRGIYAYGPVPGRILVARFGPQPEDRDAPVSLEELQRVVREVTGVEVTLTGLHGRATRWSDNARQAQSYRHGRVLLAGDAAHVHSPFSGQGLNLGLGDAVNLGWKLAATVDGSAPAGLLDTYESERHPIAEWVLNWTRAQVALMRGDEWTAQLREIVGAELLVQPEALNRMVALSAGITQHYDVADGAQAPVGSIVEDVELASGERLADHSHGGRFVLLDRSPDARFADAARAWGSALTCVLDPVDDLSLPSLLVRPDGVVIWADPQTTGPDGDVPHDQLATALARWVGSDADVLGTPSVTAMSSS